MITDDHEVRRGARLPQRRAELRRIRPRDVVPCFFVTEDPQVPNLRNGEERNGETVHAHERRAIGVRFCNSGPGVRDANALEIG